MSPDTLITGNTGDPLPSETVVFRVVKLSLDGRVGAEQFELSSKDKQSTPPSLSVWAEALTPFLQASRFLNNLEKTHVGLLSVESVRNLRPSPENQNVPALDVVWEVLWTDETARIKDSRLGAEGHSGIRGLDRPPQLNKRYYHSLRMQLAELTNQNLHPILSKA